MNQIDLTALSLPGVEVHDSGIHGLGAFASRDLPVGTKLGQYAGRRYSAEEAETVDWDSSLTYLFGLSDGTLIDGADGGNATRHLNHACEPNCEAIEVRRRGRRIVLEVRTIKPVLTGDELFIDYALTVDDSEPRTGYPCYCKSAACRGTLLGPV